MHIRSIKRNSKEYFYLEHTIRWKNKFRNKRIYLGHEIPSNIESVKYNFILRVLEEKYLPFIKNIKKNFRVEFSKYPKTAKDEYMETFMIRFTYNTNRIEGGTLTLRETADILQEHIAPRNKPIKDIKETEGHKKVFYQMLSHDRRLSMQTILDWHKIFFKEADPEIAGVIRQHPVAIARSKVELPMPAELDDLLKDFFKWYHKKKDQIHPLILAALVHLKFVTIHPFSDGNGRISRLMMNFILHKNKYPMLNIEYINRTSYYNALERSQTTNKDHVFIQYLIKKYIKSYKKFL